MLIYQGRAKRVKQNAPTSAFKMERRKGLGI
jgi:hypothetical protein